MGQQDIKKSIEAMPEKTAAKVVKGMELPLKDMEGNLIDSTKEQADRLECNITKNVTEQVSAMLEARFGSLPHPGDSSSSNTSKINRSINHAVKLRVGAENAARGAAKAKSKAKAKAKPKAKAKATSKSSSSSSSSSEDEGVKINTPRGSGGESDDAPVTRGT